MPGGVRGWGCEAPAYSIFAERCRVGIITFMKYSQEKDRKYLNWHNQRGIAWVISRDYRWFKEKYLPAIHRLEEAGLKKDRYLLSDCYYMIGDVHDFNNCPKAAIKAYKKSFALDPTHSEALREMGCLYENMGQYQKAASLLKKAIQINPNDEWAIMDYEYALDSEGTPLYQKKDIYWQAREYLAVDKPKSALKLLDKKRSIPALLIKAQAYGILDDTNAAITQWYKIRCSKSMIELAYADWFYMTDAVWDNFAFWEVIASCAKENRFSHGVWPISDSLWNKVIPSPKNRNTNSKADIVRCNKRHSLLAQYHIARINRDCELAQKLLKRYPKWLEIEKLCKKLSK